MSRRAFRVAFRRALYLIMVACFAAACGEGRPPPKAALRPAGAGWYCWRNQRSKNSSRCLRTEADCAASRNKAIAEGGNKEELLHNYGDCEQETVATCFTHTNAMQKDEWWCAISYDDCESTARTLSRDPDKAASYADLSACASWD
jgi:hypothetical protein